MRPALSYVHRLIVGPAGVGKPNIWVLFGLSGLPFKCGIVKL
jgi:hypothetical protein